LRHVLTARTAVVFTVTTALAALPGPVVAATSLGTNLVAVTDYSGALPFSDLMRTARPFCSQRQFGPYCEGEPMRFDESGFPLALPREHVARTILAADTRYLPAGIYRVRWQGTGKIELTRGVARFLRDGGHSATYRIRPKRGATLELQIVGTDPADHLRGLHIQIPKAGSGTFNRRYLDLLKPYASLRFMDWGLTNESQLTEDRDRPEPGDFTYAGPAGVPIEVMVDLANRLGANPWFNVPTRAGDGYVREMAEVVNRCLAPGLVPSLEYSNETWNGTFDQYGYTQQRGAELGLDRGDAFAGGLRYTAHRSLEIWDVWDSVFGSRPYRRVLASQSANTFTGETMLEYRRAAGEPSAGERADAYAIAPYFTIPGLDEPDRLASLRGLSVGALLDRAAADVDGRVADDLRANMELARRFGVELVAYEGGQHLVGAAGNQDDAALTRKLIAANRDRRIGPIYARYLDLWNTVVGGPLNHFTDVTVPSKFGSWGSVEFLGQRRAASHKRRALEAFAKKVNGRRTPRSAAPCR
jgi:hypothetical protein